MRRHPNLQTSAKGRPNAWDLRRLVGSVNQLRFNDNKGEVAFFGQKMIILRRDVIRIMREGLERLVGDQAAPFLSYLASGIGIHEGSIFRDSVTSTGQEQRTSLENLVHSAFEDTNLGLGKIQIRQIDFDKGTANVVISNSFEAIENGPEEEPNCMFTGGFLAGLFAEVLDRTVQAKEVRCCSQGQNECEFQISPAETEPGEPSTSEESKENISEDPSRTQTKEPAVSQKKVEPETGPESKALAKPAAPSTGDKTVQPTSGVNSVDVDAGVERASRIAKRKQGFWEKHFKKK